MPGFYIVSEYGYIVPVPYQSYELARASCDIDETVYLADSLEDLEETLEVLQQEYSDDGFLA